MKKLIRNRCPLCRRRTLTRWGLILHDVFVHLYEPEG